MVESGLEEIIRGFKDNGSMKSSSFSIEERRTGYANSNILAGDTIEIKKIKDDIIEGINVRYYSDKNKDNNPLIVYFHGGCFISGGLETHEKQMRLLTQLSFSRICFVNYRIAPEFKFPTAHNDCLKVVKKIIEMGENKIILMGDSAGGNLALSLGLSLKKNHEKIIKKIILIYPMLDPYGKFPSMNENGNDYIMTSDAFTSGYDYYLNNEKEKEDIRINLLGRNDYKGLPETHIMTADLDPLRDEGEELYKILRENNVEAYCTRYLGVPHGFYQLNGISKTSNKIMNEISLIINET